MKCIECHNIFQTTDFYDHIIVQRECVVDTERSRSEEEEEQNISDLMQDPKDIENSDFYQALNMPLQVKDDKNYQTHSNTVEDKILLVDKRLSSPLKNNASGSK